MRGKGLFVLRHLIGLKIVTLQVHFKLYRTASHEEHKENL